MRIIRRFRIIIIILIIKLLLLINSTLEMMPGIGCKEALCGIQLYHEIQMLSNSMCHQTPTVIKHQMPPNPRWRQNPDAINVCMQKNNPRCHQTPVVIKIQILSNSKCHQTLVAIKHQMPSNARCH